MGPLGPLFLTNLFRKLLSELTKRGRLFAKEKWIFTFQKRRSFGVCFLHARFFWGGGLSIPGIWCPPVTLCRVSQLYFGYHTMQSSHHPPRQVVLQPCWLPKIQLLFVASSQLLNEDHGPIENLPRFMVGFVKT